MSVSGVAKLAVALTVLALSAKSASACFPLWPCEVVYPPMYVPAYDPRRGPTWTNNGWSYLDPPRHVHPMPYWDGAVEPGPYGRARFDDRDPRDYGRALK
jgi:hypothetical protein